jgi:hypothetical protein
MKRTLIAALLVAAPAIAMADEEGSASIDLCRHEAVREITRIEHDLRPVKRVYDIAMNPTGFVIEKVSQEAGVKIPKWVGFALDPKGYARNYVMKRVREEAKQHVGLANDCRLEETGDDDSEGPFPTPEADSAEA